MKKQQVVAAVVAGIALVCLVILGLIALDERNNAGVNNGDAGSSEDVADELNGKCSVQECMKLLTPKMTLAEANDVIGFEGEKSADEENKYTWQLTKKTKVVIEYKENQGTITATYDKDQIKNSDFKIAKGYELQNLLREGTSYTYKETVEQFGGVEGYLATNAPTFKRYIWVNNDGLTFGATFSDNIDGKTSIISIR